MHANKKTLNVKLLQMKNRKLLAEACIIRPLIIILLVFIHCIAIYTGAWEKPDGVGDMPLWKWIGLFISGFRIEMIALIAGYVYAYHTLELGKNTTFKAFFVKKLKRLLIPCWAFGLLYYVLFYHSSNTFGVYSGFTVITNGAGHLWFLPMLFWCFLGLWVIDHYKLPPLPTLLALWFMSIVPASMAIHFLGFSKTFHFMFYIFLGYFLRMNHIYIIRNENWKKICLICGIAYFIIISCNSIYLQPHLAESDVFTNKVFIYIVNEFVHSVYTVLGLIALLLAVVNITEDNQYRPGPLVLEANSICYGVYVFHQFVLLYLYYNTKIPLYLNDFLLPLFMFFTTLSISVALTCLFKKTKIGGFLIG